MAASESKVSPSNKPLAEGTTEVKDVAPAEPAEAKEEATIDEPSYESSQQSQAYQTAKMLLNQGDFEAALTLIEGALEETMQKLTAFTDNPSLHPALAPWHYLYGTTLLYSLEESTDVTAPTEDEDEVDDRQIAYENLEAARVILEPLDYPLDLAQVLVRSADLLKHNEQGEQALEDYRRALDLRVKNLPASDRKLADIHYCLASTCSLLSAKGQHEYRTQAQEHYWQCARVLCSQMAEWCNVTDFWETLPQLKGDQSDVCGQFVVLRQHVGTLVPPSDKMEEVQDLLELLQEIEETVQEAESADQGVHEVTEMKEEIAKAAAGETVEENVDGSTTTVGFGSEAAAATTAAAQPLMAVRKKKRPVEDGDDDTKKPAAKSIKPSAE